MLTDQNMEIWKLLLGVLAFSTVALCYNCPNDGRTFYHADVTTGCQVYHFCQNGEMTTLTCSSGQAYDHHSGECKEASTVHCEETDHHRHRRSESEEPMIHSIPIERLKKGLEKLTENIILVVKDSVKEISPTVYDQLEANYAPSIKKLKDDLMPFFKDRVVPRLRKSFNYTKKLVGRFSKKISTSWELSNETHINLVSFSDIAQDLSSDMEPMLKLGRYLSARLAQPARAKRSAEDHSHLREMPEILEAYINPLISRIFASVREMFAGDENTLTSKFILPVIFNILEDKETRFNLKRIYWTVKAAVAPVISDMYNLQTWKTPLGTIIRIPKSQIDNALENIIMETMPLVRMVVEKHLSMVLTKASENVPLIYEAIDRLISSSEGRVGVLKDSIQRFVAKQRALIRTSDSSHFHTFTLTETLEDLKPIKVTLLQIFVDYLSRLDDSWVNAFFDRKSYLYKAILGEENYAVPSQKYLEADPDPRTNRIIRNKAN